MLPLRKCVRNTFDAASTEMRAQYHHRMDKGGIDEKFHSLSVWTPNVNIFRDPRWGRGQETYGEDPYLTSRMGIAVVRGLQGPEDSKYRKLWACAKHYAVHSGPEYTRHTANLTDVTPRDLWETYMPAFKATVQKANVREVMCAYQRLDDDPCCGNNRLLQQILRDDWGFKYLVVSDCGAVSDFYTSHKRPFWLEQMWSVVLVMPTIAFPMLYVVASLQKPKLTSMCSVCLRDVLTWARWMSLL